MDWTFVIDQQRVRQALARAIAQDRVAHAYLFHGPEGSGKRAAALAFARAMLCGEGPLDPCPSCGGPCRVARLIHPDIHVLFPYPSDVDESDVAERLQRLAEEPYAAIDYVRRPHLNDPSKASNKQALYRVDRIHQDVRRTMSFKPLEGRYKVAIMTDADALRVEAANAFLKLLEEPAPQSLFILTTSRPDRLLPTILSRCQRLRFDPLPPDAIATALETRADVPADRAAMLARMADGSFTRALDLVENDDLLAQRALVLDFMRQVYVHNVSRLADLVEQLGRLSREQVKGVLTLFLSWLRDLMLYQTMGDAAPLINVDQTDAIRKFCTHVGDARIDAMVQQVEQALELVEGNVQTGLIFTNLAFAMRRAMVGQDVPRLHVALAEPDAG